MNLTILLKTIFYRLTNGLITFIITLIISGSISLSFSIGIIDLFFKTFYYYYFDLLWNKNMKNRYKPCVIWLTGLSGSGKTAISNNLSNNLNKKGIKTIVLDGDEIRNIFQNSNFDKHSRIQHNINVGYMSALFEKQGYIVIVSLISPYSEARDKNRTLCNKFIETYISTPLNICEKRDPKGLYKKCRAGQIKEFTGINSPYEIPEKPEISIDTTNININQCVNIILKNIIK